MRLLLLAAVVVSVHGLNVQITNHWNGGFQGTFTLHADQDLHGWKVHMHFNPPVNSVEIWKARVAQKLNGGAEFVLENLDFDADLSSGTDMDVIFVVRQNGDQVPSVTATLEGAGGGGGSNPGTGNQGTGGGHTGTGGGNPITAAPSSGGGSSTKYDYKKALGLSILFFDAQRSGRLPANNPIPWRGDSAVNDGDSGHDLSGGWYDAGDHVKFNLPMSYSTWVLGWGFLRFKDAYVAAGQKDMMCDMIKWPLDYFLKCWIPDQQVYYVQVGDGGADHGYWGRPENMHMGRPAFKVDAGRGGSDVAGDTAAAFAVGSMVFKDICGDSGYADRLLGAAKSIYEFAKNHKGIYSNSVPQAKNFYGSTGYNDELSVAANFLYQATKNAGYLQDAKGFHQGGVPWALSWDDTKVAADLLLYENTKDSQYSGDVEGFVRSYMDGGSVPHTPCGLAWRDQWGSNRYAGNAAFVATMAAADGLSPDAFKKFAMSQINYLLGDNKYHMSYEIGFGSNFPRRPHHRGSSCPTNGGGCSPSGGNNPNQLNGALVGGPDQGDNYADRRDDYVKNEVACDYNAGFQSALAGLVHFAVNNNLPAAPATKC